MPRKRAPYFKFYPDDWRTGTITLNYEQKGFLIDVMAVQWDLGGDLPGEIKELARLLRCNPRTARKLAKQLIEIGKLVEKEGRLSNARMAQEITKFVNRKKAASKREATKRGADIEPETLTVPPEFELNSSPIQAEFRPNLTRTEQEKSIKTTTEGAEQEVTPEARSQKPEEEPPLPPLRGGTGSEFWLSALNPTHNDGSLGVTREKSGKIHLHNGTKQHFLELFGNEKVLALALDAIAPHVQPNGRAPVQAQVASLLSEKARRDLMTREHLDKKFNPNGEWRHPETGMTNKEMVAAAKQKMGLAT